MALRSSRHPPADNTEWDELPLEGNFVEQAEYISADDFEALSADHPEEESIIRSLSLGGAKLLVGPRGCGKTTMMLKAYYRLLRDYNSNTLPVYVNFKLSLKLEPLYVNTPNASYWFKLWLNLRVYEGIYTSISDSKRLELPPSAPSLKEIKSIIAMVEAGRIDSERELLQYTTDGLRETIERVLENNDLSRCVLLLDDAAHAFSPRQQEDFFEFFRQIKSRSIAPKAAIYPGITTYSQTFHVGHDAEQIDVWSRPDKNSYIQFMRSLAQKRFNGTLPTTLQSTPDALEFLAFTSFGIPRSFLNMLRTIYHEENNPSSSSGLDRRRILEIAKQSREMSHNVYDSLVSKLPTYKNFVQSGRSIYENILTSIKAYNRNRALEDQALEIGIKRPISSEGAKVLSFLQYSGLLMPAGQNSRGEKGVFDIYVVHYGDLVTENAIVGRRTKSIALFVKAFKAQTHQAWPRTSLDTLIGSDNRFSFTLALPHCQACGAERMNEDAKFCHRCGSQLKSASLYDQLTNQDISVLPLSNTMINRIKSHSTIRIVRDILIDTDRSNLRSIPQIGPVRAARIATYAEEYVA